MFINSRSGGRAGPKLTQILYQSLGHAQVCMQYTGICFRSDEQPVCKVEFCLQVFDLQEYRPGPVLKHIWENFAKREQDGDQIAPIMRRSAGQSFQTCMSRVLLYN